MNDVAKVLEREVLAEYTGNTKLVFGASFVVWVRNSSSHLSLHPHQRNSPYTDPLVRLLLNNLLHGRLEQLARSRRVQVRQLFSFSRIDADLHPPRSFGFGTTFSCLMLVVPVYSLASALWWQR